MARTLTDEIISAAIEGFEAQKTRIDGQIAELRAMLAGGTAEPSAAPVASSGKRKKFSSAARKRMQEAQQRRWAKVRGELEPVAPVTPQPPKGKRTLSAAGRKNIVDALRRRWAAAKKAEGAKQAKRTAPRGKNAAVKKAAKRPAPAKVAASTPAQ